MKDILYITLKVQAAQNVSIQMIWLEKQSKQKYIYLTINGLAKTGETGPLPPALYLEQRVNTTANFYSDSNYLLQILLPLDQLGFL